MKIRSLKIDGCYVIEPEKQADTRGFFTRTWCHREFTDKGLVKYWVQSNISFNKKRGTLRGMHLQKAPHGEVKLVRVTRGAIYDVIVDLRKNSSTYLKWESVELTETNSMSLYIATGVAHGFMSLEDNTEVFYEMSEYFHPESANGYRYNDPSFNITWPDIIPIICSEKDRSYPNFSD